MKKLLLPLLFSMLLPVTFSCSAGRLAGYSLNEADAASAIRQLLQIGARDGINASFTKDAVMTTLFPEPLRKTLNTLQQLGLTSEIDRFTNTVTAASEKTAEKSIPIFINAIDNMKFSDAMRIIKDGGTAATDYLRTTTGAELRQAITPVMQTALEEYKLNEQWNKIMKPAQTIAGNKFNLDLANLLAGMISEKMFQQIAEKETQIRSDAAARTTPLLQKVFSRSWN